jgi:hypothetical protein
MGHPKNSTKYHRINLSKTPTHKCHQAAHDQAPGGVKKRGDLSYWETPLTNNDNEMIQNMCECLDSVLLECIKRCVAVRKMERFHTDYIS